MDEVLKFALCQRDERVRVHGAQEIDWGAFENAVERHRLSSGLNLLRDALTSGCSAIWGPVRGARAARRLTFEVSWRVAGAYTYTAGGWPGRMFYAAS
jgi:spore maturation protein CgeB